jgi:hypothetical protein
LQYVSIYKEDPTILPTCIWTKVGWKLNIFYHILSD